MSRVLRGESTVTSELIFPAQITQVTLKITATPPAGIGIEPGPTVYEILTLYTPEYPPLETVEITPQTDYITPGIPQVLNIQVTVRDHQGNSAPAGTMAEWEITNPIPQSTDNRISPERLFLDHTGSGNSSLIVSAETVSLTIQVTITPPSSDPNIPVDSLVAEYHLEPEFPLDLDHITLIPTPATLTSETPTTLTATVLASFGTPPPAGTRIRWEILSVIPEGIFAVVWPESQRVSESGTASFLLTTVSDTRSVTLRATASSPLSATVGAIDSIFADITLNRLE